MTRSRFWWIRLAALVFGSFVVVFLVFVIDHAEPILKARVIETLSARFHGPVELAQFHVSVANGFQVSGAGLKIFGPGDPNPHEPGIQPLISIGEFRFGASIINLLHTPMRIHRVYLKALELNIPPREQRTSGVRGGKTRSTWTSSSANRRDSSLTRLGLGSCRSSLISAISR